MSKIDKLTSYLKDSPEDPFLHFALAKEYEKQGDMDNAVSRYEHLMQTHPDYVGTYYHAGKLYEIQEMYEKAMMTYEHGIRVAQQADDTHSATELQGAKMSLQSLS